MVVLVCLTLFQITVVLVCAQDPGSTPSVPLNPGRYISANPAQIKEALATLTSLADQYRQSGNRQAEANALCAMGNSYAALRQQQKAIEQFLLALAIWHEFGNKEEEATTLAHMGDVYRGWGFPEQANRYYRDALNVYPPSDKAGRAATLNNESLTWFSMNNKRKCFESINGALALFRELGDRRGEAMALANLGTAYTFLGNEPQKAIETFQDAVAKLDLLGEIDSEASALDKMGVAWHNMGKSEMAVLSFQHAIEHFHQAGDAEGEAAVRKHMRALGEPKNVAQVH